MASFLWLLRCTYSLAVDIKSVTYDWEPEEISALKILYPLLDNWVSVAVLILLIVITRRPVWSDAALFPAVEPTPAQTQTAYAPPVVPGHQPQSGYGFAPPQGQQPVYAQHPVYPPQTVYPQQTVYPPQTYPPQQFAYQQNPAYQQPPANLQYTISPPQSTVPSSSPQGAQPSSQPPSQPPNQNPKEPAAPTSGIQEVA